jgi:flagellar biosynthesis protein FlhG
MTDQAHSLRDLIERRQSLEIEDVSGVADSIAHTIAVTSGKGGVGKSNIALNLAIALSEMDLSVCLLDANLGLGNIDLLCGLNGYWNFSHVVTGARTLEDVMLEGPKGIRVIPGLSDLEKLAELPPAIQKEIIGQLVDIENTSDVLVIDTGIGAHNLTRRLVSAVDFAILVTTPEPTSVADAYATIKSFSLVKEAHFQVLVNQSESNQKARSVLERLQQTTRLFARTGIEPAGFILRDDHVPQAVEARVPFLVTNPQCPASQGIRQLARRMNNLINARPTRGAFFKNLWERDSLSKAA